MTSALRGSFVERWHVPSRLYNDRLGSTRPTKDADVDALELATELAGLRRSSMSVSLMYEDRMSFSLAWCISSSSTLSTASSTRFALSTAQLAVVS